jgi:hypothetical protein
VLDVKELKLVQSTDFIQALRDAGIVPESTMNVIIRAPAIGGFVQVMYDGVEDGETLTTTRRMSEADARGIEGITAAALLGE